MDGPVVHVVAQVSVHACTEAHVTSREGRARRAARRPRSLHLRGEGASAVVSTCMRGGPGRARTPSGAIRRNQAQSGPIRGNQSSSVAIRAHQSHLGVAQAHEKVPVLRTHRTHGHALGKQQAHPFARRLRFRSVHLWGEGAVVSTCMRGTQIGARRHYETQSEIIRGHPRSSEAIRADEVGNQMAIRAHQGSSPCAPSQ